MKMTKILTEGKLIPTDDGRVRIVTPMLRFSYPFQTKPRDYQGDGKFRWTTTGIFNVSGEGLYPVNLNAVLVPAIASVAKNAGIPLAKIKDKVVRKGDGAEKMDDDGEYKAGFGPGTVYCTFSKYPNEDQSNIPPIRDGKKNILKPSDVVPGHYGRIVVNVYANDYKTVSLGLEEVQVLAIGDRLGGGGGGASDAFDEVPDADDFTKAETDFSANDLFGE